MILVVQGRITSVRFVRVTGLGGQTEMKKTFRFASGLHRGSVTADDLAAAKERMKAEVAKATPVFYLFDKGDAFLSVKVLPEAGEIDRDSNWTEEVAPTPAP